MGKVHVFTSAALNYMPQVRVLFRSLKEHHPEFKLILALSDDMEKGHDFSSEPVDEALPASQLKIPAWKGWAFCHDIVELSVGIKPFALLNLLSRPECSKVIYLDPDIVLFSRIDDILETLEHANLVLTPHQNSSKAFSFPTIEREIDALKDGLFNLGFFGVNQTREGKRFAEWWAKRVYRICRNDRPNGLFYDQRWIDLAPVFFEGVEIIKSSRYNVAPWNLATRKLTGNFREGFQVNGEPLGFYHYSSAGIDGHREAVISYIGQNDCVMEIIDWYEKETDKLSNDPLAKSPWAYGMFSNGEPILNAHRIMYRERVDLQIRFPDPFDCSHPESYYQYWKDNARINWLDVRTHISQSLINKAYRKKLAGDFWNVIRTEGVAGVFSRVRSR